MKKSLTMFLAAAFAVFALSCEQADDARFMIVGTWESTTPMLPAMPFNTPLELGAVADDSPLPETNQVLLTWTFNKNGTGKIRRDGSCIWKLSDGDLIISHDDGSVQRFTVMELTPTRLSLRGEVIAGVGVSDYSFIKK
jgi:hypothetical protein